MSKIKLIYLIILTFLISCREGQEVNNVFNGEKNTVSSILKEDLEEYALQEPLQIISDTDERNIYKSSEIILESNSENQKLIFKKGSKYLDKLLSFYYEYSGIEFQLYKSSINNHVILVEGIDYYSGSFGVYYIDNKSNSIIELDTDLSYTQYNPEEEGVKKIKAKISKNNNILDCCFYLGNNLLFKKRYDLSSYSYDKSNISEDWYGKYNMSFLRLKDESSDPRGWGKVDIKISKDSLNFYLFSYVEEENFKLKFIREEEDNLILSMAKSDTLIINKNNEKYSLQSSYLDKLLSNKEVYDIEK